MQVLDFNRQSFVRQLRLRLLLQRTNKPFARFALWLLALGMLSACSTAPVQLTDAEREQRAAQSLEQLFAKYPEINQDVTLGEAMARALLFNLDDRVQLMKIAVEEKAQNVERLDLLPKLTLEAGYSNLSENLASYNKNTVTEIRSTQPTLSSEDETTQANLSLAWNLLDFGVSYVRSQQQADRFLIAEARRQQTMQNVLTDVRSAFWRAYAAQQWEAPIEQLLADLEIGLENSRRAGESGAVTKEEALRVQSGLLETMGDLLAIKRRLASAKNELAGLMNLRPGNAYRLTLSESMQKQIDGARRAQLSELKLTERQVEGLEERALTTRPELHIADYNVRIMQRDIKRLMLSMLPGIDFNLGGYYDGNDFKRYDQYTKLGLNVGYDLFNLLKWPKHRQHAENKVLLEEEKRKALAMAVLTQLHVALAQHGLTQRQLRYANRLALVDEKILAESRNQLRVGEARPHEVLQSRLNYVESGLTRDWLFAERQRTVDQLYIAAGISLAEALPRKVVEQNDLAAKLSDVARSMKSRSELLHNPQDILQRHAGKEAVSAAATVSRPSQPRPPRESTNKPAAKQPNSQSTATPSTQSPNRVKAKPKSAAPGSAGLATQYLNPQVWCVHFAYFEAAANAERHTQKLSKELSRNVNSVFSGKGYYVRSGPLQYNEAYDLRAQARQNVAKDAFIRKCADE